MLSQQFFNRAQLTKILGFKSVSMLQSLETKGLIKPDIKPSKYSLNQVIFVFICKEFVDFTPLTWKNLIDFNFNVLLKEDLYNNDLLTIFKKSDVKDCYIYVNNNSKLVDKLDEYLDVNAIDALSNIPGLNNITYENIASIHVVPDKENSIMTLSLKRLRRKLNYKCNELKISLEDKVLA
jgi:hypothetical protein